MSQQNLNIMTSFRRLFRRVAMVDSIFTITLKVFVRLIRALNILGKLRTTAKEGNPSSLRHVYTPGVNNCRQMNSRGFFVLIIL